MTSRIGSRFAVIAAASVCLTTSAALATPFPSDAVMFRLHASNAIGQGTFYVKFKQGTYIAAQQRYVWALAAPVTIFDTHSGLPLARLLAASAEYIEDPVVNLSFNVEAGGILTNFEVASALLSFPTIDSPQGQASVGLSVTDTGSDGATLTGLVPGGGSYLAQYNGLAPGGTTFAQLLQSVSASAGESNTDAANVPGGNGFLPIAGGASDMSSRFDFQLTANDLASGTSHWEVVVPTPSALAFLILGAAGLGRKRRA